MTILLKPLAAASAAPRSAPVEPPTGSDPHRSADFGDALEAAQQAAQSVAPRGQGNGQGNPQASRPVVAGTPAAPPNAAAQNSTPPLPAAMRDVDAETADSLPAAGSPGVPIRSRGHEPADASPAAKPAADSRPNASAAATHAPTPAVAPDVLAAAIMQAVPVAADPPDIAVGAHVEETQAAAQSSAGLIADSGIPAAAPGVAATPNDTAGEPGATATSQSGLMAAAQSLLS
jgi:hypothetical protein